MRALEATSSALLVLTLTACPSAASPPSDGDGWQSGSRLRAIVERASDGTRAHVGWHDTLLDVDCRFARDATGAARCLPLGGLDVVYADAACTRRMHRLAPCAETPAYVGVALVAPPSECGDDDPLGARLEIHALATAERADRPYFYLDGSGACAAAGGPDVPMVPDAGVIDPSRFADAVVERRPLVGRLSEDVVVASDGAEQRVAVFDTGLGQRCWPGEPGILGVSACVPWNVVAYADVIPWRADAACTHSLAHGGWPAPCPVVAVIRGVRDGACTVSAELDAIGAQFSGTIYEGRDAARCAPIADRPTERWFEIGAPITNDTLVRTAVQTRGTGTATLRVATRDGVAIAPLGWTDGEARPCEPMRFADGVTRCVAGVEGVDTAYVFADPACTEALFGGAECGSAALGLRSTTDACSQTATEVVVLEPTPTPATVFALDGAGLCARTTTASGTYTRIAGTVPLDTLPRLEVVVE